MAWRNESTIVVSTVPFHTWSMESELKPGEWLDDKGDPDVVDEMNQMLDALGVPKVKP